MTDRDAHQSKKRVDQSCHQKPVYPFEWGALKRFTIRFMLKLRSNILATITRQLTSEITSRLVQGKPEDEDGDAGVLDARLDGDGNDVFERPAAEFGGDAAEAKPEPGQRHAGDENTP